MRWLGDSPPAAMSPLVKPMSTSLISGEGDAGVPSFNRKLVRIASMDPSRGGGVGRVPKRGSAVWGVPSVVSVSLVGVCHALSHALSRMSSIFCRGSARLAYASSSASLGSMFCQICVGRRAPDPHLGALRTVEGPIMAIMCAGSKG